MKGIDLFDLFKKHDKYWNFTVKLEELKLIFEELDVNCLPVHIEYFFDCFKVEDKNFDSTQPV